MSLCPPYRLTAVLHYPAPSHYVVHIVPDPRCTFHCCAVLNFYNCFLKAGNSTELVHTEVVVRLCARAGLSEHSVPAATSALRMPWQNATLLHHITRRPAERRFSNRTRIHSGGKPTSPGSDKQRDSAGVT